MCYGRTIKEGNGGKKMGNVTVAWEDVISVIQMVRTHLIVIGAALVCMILLMVLARRWAKPLRGFIRWQSFIGFLLITAIVVNVMLTGALNNTLNVVLADRGELSQENADNSRQVIEEITNEGVVMTKNDEDFLPIEPQKINVFGWASTKRILFYCHCCSRKSRNGTDHRRSARLYRLSAGSPGKGDHLWSRGMADGRDPGKSGYGGSLSDGQSCRLSKIGQADGQKKQNLSSHADNIYLLSERILYRKRLEKRLHLCNI